MRSRIDIGFNWDKLLEVNFNHQFYQDGKGRDFEFVPTNKTSVLFKNFKIFYKSVDNGFMIFCNAVPFRRIHALKKITDQKLTFLVKNKSSNLANYSNISFNHFDEVFYFTNLDVNKTKDSVLLHEEEYMTNQKKIRVFSPFQVLKYAKLAKVNKLLNHRGKEVKREIWYEERFDMHVVKLKHLKEGKYSFVNGKESTEFYVMDYIKEPVWGVLDIHLYDLPKGAGFLEKEKIVPIEYEICLQARSTYWKYFIIGQNKELELKLDEAKISYNGEDIAFTKPVKVTLSNGIEAFSIESKKPMELKELHTVKDKLELKLKKDNKWQNKTYRVPKPTVKRVKPDKTSNKVYSTTYIYV